MTGAGPTGRAPLRGLITGLFVATLAIGMCLVLLTIGLMVSYDLRHPGIHDCAPLEDSGQLGPYPCGPDQPYYLSPSGVTLLAAFLTGQPEPTPRVVMP